MVRVFTMVSSWLALQLVVEIQLSSARHRESVTRWPVDTHPAHFRRAAAAPERIRRYQVATSLPPCPTRIERFTRWPPPTYALRMARQVRTRTGCRNNSLRVVAELFCDADRVRARRAAAR